MTTGIYKITNTINNMSYIGQSIQIEQRWRAHKTLGMSTTNSKDTQYPLYFAMKKYGIDVFTFEILEECTKEELNQKEIFYIEKYDSYRNGYNLSLGGDTPPYNGKATCQWDLEGNLIKRWPSGMAAANALGVCKNSIYQVINGKRKTCCGYMWTREEDGQTPHFEEYKGGQPIAIIQYDLQGNKVAEYGSIKEAADALGCSQASNIQAAVSGKSNTAYGFQWRRANQPAPSATRTKQPRRLLYQYTLDGELVKVWENAKQAAISLGYCDSVFYTKKWVNGEVVCYGYLWSRYKK